MNLEAGLAKAAVSEIHPLFIEMMAELRAVKQELAEIRKASEKPLSIAECCDILQCDKSTFWKLRKRYGIEPCGGTSGKPIFFKSDILGIDWTKRQKYDV